MRAFHDTRDSEYRAPYGAIELGTTVELSLDVWAGPNANAKLRTWVDGAGETLYEMTPSPREDGSMRFSTRLKPAKTGIVWYQFVVSDENGASKRYGALEGRRGGTGQLLDWEPPSFQLTVFDPAKSGDDLLADCELLADDALAPTSAALRFLRGEGSAFELVRAIHTAHEILPAAVFKHNFEFLGASDRKRLLALLGGMNEAEIPESDGNEDRELALDAHKIGLAKGRLWCASLIELLMPGLGHEVEYRSQSCVSDEGATEESPRNTTRHTTRTSMEDSRDAKSASVKPIDAISAWGLIDPDCQTIMVNAADLSCALPPLDEESANPAASCFALNDDVFGFWRKGTDGSTSCLLINASLAHAHDVAIPIGDGEVTEVIAGYGMRIVDSLYTRDANTVAHEGQRCAIVHLNQIGSAVLYLHPEELLQKPMEAGFGVLAHITSLPSGKQKRSRSSKSRPAQLGHLGAQARAFVDWLAQAGVRYWQVLPANPTDEYGSPYAGISAFAGNIRLLDGDAMPGDDEWARIEASDEYRQFCQEQGDWLEPYVSFMAIRDKQRSKKVWQAWPKKYRVYDPELIQSDQKLCELATLHRHEQFIFDREWNALRSYASERGVAIIGDMPIYVSADSADVWAHPELFQLGADGNPELVAGCPPDAFAEDGQVWGNPIYDWDTLRATNYDWWMRRLARAFELYDYVRLDHFIGFSRYFAIPAGELATQGAYRPGPGIDFFHEAFRQFGPLPIIAEDLGLITPAVRALVAECGFPGMDIVQFVDGNDPLSGYTPRPGKIVYTGTHDNQTLVGYCAERYPHLDAHEAAEELARKAASCAAPVCIMPLQDLMGLDDEARMNVPGTAEGNWTWQAEQAGIDQALAYTRELVKLHG